MHITIILLLIYLPNITYIIYIVYIVKIPIRIPSGRSRIGYKNSKTLGVEIE